MLLSMICNVIRLHGPSRLGTLDDFNYEWYPACIGEPLWQWKPTGPGTPSVEVHDIMQAVMDSGHVTRCITSER